MISYLRESLRELWKRPAHQVPALDGLRACAILLVVGSHFFGEFWTNFVTDPLPGMAKWAPFNWGWTGVDLFFVLSGYLIGKQLWRERLDTGTVQFREFILRRGFRIWPLYFFVITFYAITGLAHVNTWDFLFLTNFVRGSRGFDDAWSLATEEQFYIIVPLLLIATAAVRRPWMYFVGMAGTVVVEWLLRAEEVHRLAGNGLTGHALLDMTHYPIYLHCDALVAGLAIALLSVLRPKRFHAPVTAGVSWRGLAIFVAATALGVGLRMANKSVFNFAALGLLYGSLALWVLWDRSILTAPWRWRIWYPISRLSYGMYLNNFVVLPGITFFAFTSVLRGSGSIMAACVVGLLVGTVVSMSVATVTFVFVERPFLILRDRVLGRHVHMPPGVASGVPAPVWTVEEPERERAGR